MAKTLVVQSAVKEVIKENGYNTAGDFMDALSTEVENLVKQACKRCGANTRKTVRGTDL